MNIASTSATWSTRLRDLGIELPPVAVPAAAYLPAVRTGNLVYTSGQLPLVGGTCTCTGKVGGTVSVADASAAARLCALNALAAVDDLVGLDNIVRAVKVVGFVACSEGFSGQPDVINGASDFLREAFGDAGRHARSAIGLAELPRGSAVEIEFLFEVR